MPSLPAGSWTLVALAREQAKRFGDRPFIRLKDGPAISFADLDRRSDRLALALAHLGVGGGDRVFSLVRNRIELLDLLLATNKRRAIFVPINTEIKGAFLQHQLRNSEPRIVVVDAELVPAFATVDPDGLPIEAVVLVGGRPAELPASLSRYRVLALEDLSADGDPAQAVSDPEPHDISTVMYTSGTTGPSKGVLMPHAHVVLMAAMSASTMRLTEDDVYYVCMPLFHANGLFMQTIGSLVAGSSVVLARRFSASSWLDDVRESRATVTNGLGVMPEFIFRQPATPRDRDHRLRAMMAVPIAPEWGFAFAERFGVKIVQGFGMTECNIVAYTSLEDPLEPGCCGPILDDWFEVRIVDPGTDEELPAGERGEIVIRPKRPGCFMQGYFRMPEKTVEAWRNLWFHTGDAGRLDERGRLWFIDRIKDCIRRRGENISSFEVEQVLNSHPAVAESAVVAARSSIPGGEDEVKACVVLRPGAALTPAELLDFCQPRMPRYAVPRYVELLDSLPKTATGKVQKAELRDHGTDATWDREAAGYVLSRG